MQPLMVLFFFVPVIEKGKTKRLTIPGGNDPSTSAVAQGQASDIELP